MNLATLVRFPLLRFGRQGGSHKPEVHNFEGPAVFGVLQRVKTGRIRQAGGTGSEGWTPCVATIPNPGRRKAPSQFGLGMEDAALKLPCSK